MYTEPQVYLAGMIGMQEIIVILLVVLLLFGGKKIPELMRGLGKGVKEYKKAVSGVEEELSNNMQDDIPKDQHTEKND
jgi:sec-independent protein translocase protein TatA